MRFREWHLLTEFDHYSLEAPQTLNGVKCDGLDFRFEDWRKGLKPTNPGQAGEVSMSMPNPAKLMQIGSYRAPCKEGWLVIDKRNMGGEKTPTMGGLALAQQAKPDIQVIRQIEPEVEELIAMPPDWFRFAILYMGNNVVKAPEWPRGEYELVKGMGQTEMKPNPLRVEEGRSLR